MIGKSGEDERVGKKRIFRDGFFGMVFGIVGVDGVGGWWRGERWDGELQGA